MPVDQPTPNEGSSPGRHHLDTPVGKVINAELSRGARARLLRFLEESKGGSNIRHLLACNPGDIVMIDGFGEASVNALARALATQHIKLCSPSTGAVFPRPKKLTRKRRSRNDDIVLDTTIRNALVDRLQPSALTLIIKYVKTHTSGDTLAHLIRCDAEELFKTPGVGDLSQTQLKDFLLKQSLVMKSPKTGGEFPTLRTRTAYQKSIAIQRDIGSIE